MKLNEFLQNWRQERKLKLRDLAAKSGIDQSLLSKYESGARTPSAQHLPLLADALELDARQLKARWLADKFEDWSREYHIPIQEVMMVMEDRTEFLYGERALEVPPLSTDLLEKLDRIDGLREQWRQRKPLNQAQLSRMAEFFNIEYTFESNRIEGNTLTLQETSLVVNHGITIGNKSLREHLEAINHAEAVEYIAGLATSHGDLNTRTLRELHSLVLKSIDRDNAGRWRTVPVRISGSRHEPPQPFMIEKMMENYFNHYDQQKGQMHPVILAAEMHERLVSIHPFIDGNGRTSRLVMNLVLLRNGYTIANLKGDNASRLAYYKALERAQVDNEPTAFYHLVADAVEASLNAHLAMT